MHNSILYLCTYIILYITIKQTPKCALVAKDLHPCLEANHFGPETYVFLLLDMSLDLRLLPRVGARFLALSAEIPMWRPSCHLAADEKALLRLLKVNSSGFSLLTSKSSTICKLNCQFLFIPLNTTFCRLIQPFRLLQLAKASGQRCVSARGAKEELSLMMSGRQNWQRIICKTSLEMCHSHMTTLKSCRSASTMVTCEEGEEVGVHGTHATCYIQNSSSLLLCEANCN